MTLSICWFLQGLQLISKIISDLLKRFGAQVVIIGRSKKLSSIDGGIDMGLVCKAFGGGGHFGAASATVKNLSFHQVIEELFAHLSYLCGPKYSVSELMTKSPILLSRLVHHYSYM